MEWFELDMGLNNARLQQWVDSSPTLGERRLSRRRVVGSERSAASELGYRSRVYWPTHTRCWPIGDAVLNWAWQPLTEQ